MNTVRAQHLTTPEIIEAIDSGDFYASTGEKLDNYKATPTTVR
jgi:hypothetical protein